MNPKSLKTLEYNKIINTLASFAVSEVAKERSHKLVPMTDIHDINAALSETNDALTRIYRKGSPSMSGIRDIRASIKRLEIGSSLSISELLSISSLLNCTEHVKNFYEETIDCLSGYFNSLDPLSKVNSSIKRCIISEDEISDDASANLREIRRQKKLAAERVHTELTKMLNQTLVRNCLQDCIITMRSNRYCLPVKAEYKSQIPGMVHDQSSTGSTLFIEPTVVVKLNNDIRELELKEQAEIEAILIDLSARAAEFTDELGVNFCMLTELDFIFAKAKLSKHYNCSRPDMNTNHIINIKKGRHPLIDAHSVVPIDIYLGDSFNLLIVTGPNTGGKTVSLKTVGLLTLMAQSGLNIPAMEHSDIAVFNEVYADIGDEQSIEQSLSTFSSHMTNTVSILNKADENSLILFDEIGAGTDPTEGAALAISILNDLHNRSITTMATTHYSEIKVYALSTPGVENACCEFDVASLKPTYRLLIGVPGKSNAFAISSKLGLPSYIIEDATKRINAEDIHFEDLLTDLENSRITIAKEQAEIEAYKSEIASLKAEIAAKSKKLDERTDKIIRKANEKAAEILQEAKDYADETIKTMNKQGVSIKELEKQRSAVREKVHKKKAKLTLKEEKPKSFKPHDISEFSTGQHVKVISMNLIGTVTAIAPSKGEVTVTVGSMTTKTRFTNLEILNNYKDPDDLSYKANKTGSGAIKLSKSAHVSTEINLLGLTVDEAVFRLDKYLDDAYIAKLPSVRVVHGKGTGALRNGVTAFLRGVSYVKSFRLGEIGEGDAGVTIVEFK